MSCSAAAGSVRAQAAVHRGEVLALYGAGSLGRKYAFNQPLVKGSAEERDQGAVFSIHSRCDAEDAGWHQDTDTRISAAVYLEARNKKAKKGKNKRFWQEKVAQNAFMLYIRLVDHA